MKLIVAVSGGVDSVVLLHQLVEAGAHELVVAHFDHGIRPDSAHDSAFVAELARQYELPFEARREVLGPDASEDIARRHRYAFLRDIAQAHGAAIATAHHMDDIAETIAINLTRGTGWRGLAVLASDVYRPLLGMTKADIIAYATAHDLLWHEDSTNQSDAYLRNRLRKQLHDEDTTRQLAALRARQVELRDEMAQEVKRLSLDSPYTRHFFIMVDEAVAHECLRTITQARLTRPQQQRALAAIASHKPGRRYEAGSGVVFDFSLRHFTIEGLSSDSLGAN